MHPASRGRAFGSAARIGRSLRNEHELIPSLVVRWGKASAGRRTRPAWHCNATISVVHPLGYAPSVPGPIQPMWAICPNVTHRSARTSEHHRLSTGDSSSGESHWLVPGWFDPPFHEAAARPRLANRAIPGRHRAATIGPYGITRAQRPRTGRVVRAATGTHAYRKPPEALPRHRDRSTRWRESSHRSRNRVR